MGPRTELAVEVIEGLLHELYDVEGGIEMIYEGPADHQVFSDHVVAELTEILRGEGQLESRVEHIIDRMGRYVVEAILLDRREKTGGHLRVIE